MDEEKYFIDRNNSLILDFRTHVLTMAITNFYDGELVLVVIGKNLDNGNAIDRNELFYEIIDILFSVIGCDGIIIIVLIFWSKQ